MDNILKNILTEGSKLKLNDLKITNNTYLNPYLKKLLDDMYIAFRSDIKLSYMKAKPVSDMANIFKEFDLSFNETNKSKLQTDLDLMDTTMSFKLHVGKDTIKINFIMKNNICHNLISTILHAINTFAHLFPFNYNKLTIYVCLDTYTRNFEIDMVNKILSTASYDDVFKYLQSQSGAFTVGGVTQRYDNKITITKIEEIVKLLYHELIHYVGLDNKLLHTNPGNFGLRIEKENLYLSEAYTEFMAVLLNTAYHTIHFVTLHITNFYTIYEQYSIFLDLEIQYSVQLVANVLKFYGYNSESYRDFFSNNGAMHTCPISIWEYVILRTQLLLNLDSVLSILDGNWKITSKNMDKIMSLMKIDNNLIDALYYPMMQPLKNNISYILLDFNWCQV